MGEHHLHVFSEGQGLFGGCLTEKIDGDLRSGPEKRHGDQGHHPVECHLNLSSAIITTNEFLVTCRRFVFMVLAVTVGP